MLESRGIISELPNDDDDINKPKIDDNDIFGGLGIDEDSDDEIILIPDPDDIDIDDEDLAGALRMVLK